MNIVSFRPGVISNGTAFEAMALIYKYLQNNYGYKFIIVKSEDDNYKDPEFEIVSIPKKSWKITLFNYYKPDLNLNNTIKNYFDKSDIILTVDPTIYPQGMIAIDYAHKKMIPVFFDASLTITGIKQGFLWRIKRKVKLKKTIHKVTGIIITVPKCIERFKNIGLFNEKIADKFTIMGHPVCTDYFVPGERKENDKIKILVVSRLVPEKGLFYIVEAILPILREREDIELKIIGEGPLLSLLKRIIIENGIENKVFFQDVVPHSELVKQYQQADVFVNHAVSVSNWEEFFGVANLEAMACGLPVVVTKNGGIPYVIREEDCALFVEERNIIELRRALIYLINNPGERKRIGENARKYVERYYSLERIGERYNNMLLNGFGEKK
ncbi:MAG: glycosyltransferase family 4 protein [Clostridiales bacterium]|nr:glycosyltransferase family 4 protein [Clostridiales bacterium]MCF8023161.1 glycosyltransferase family 4 protein [Clostridiales bacterium]